MSLHSREKMLKRSAAKNKTYQHLCAYMAMCVHVMACICCANRHLCSFTHTWPLVRAEYTCGLSERSQMHGRIPTTYCKLLTKFHCADTITQTHRHLSLTRTRKHHAILAVDNWEDIHAMPNINITILSHAPTILSFLLCFLPRLTCTIH